LLEDLVRVFADNVEGSRFGEVGLIVGKYRVDLPLKDLWHCCRGKVKGQDWLILATHVDLRVAIPGTSDTPDGSGLNGAPGSTWYRLLKPVGVNTRVTNIHVDTFFKLRVVGERESPRPTADKKLVRAKNGPQRRVPAVKWLICRDLYVENVVCVLSVVERFDSIDIPIDYLRLT